MLLGAYLLVARVLRWNVTAYAVALFAFVPPPAGLGWLLKQSNWEFRGVGVARLVVMLGPALLVLAVGLWQRRRARARTAL
jgi:hypothetical protein